MPERERGCIRGGDADQEQRNYGTMTVTLFEGELSTLLELTDVT
jgi:hypothetical protein